MPPVPGGVHSSSPADVPDATMVATFSAALAGARDKINSRIRFSAQRDLKRAVEQIAGWPWPPTDPRAPALASAVAHALDGEVDLGKLDRMAAGLAEQLAPSGSGVPLRGQSDADVVANSTWRRLFFNALRSLAIETYEFEVGWSEGVSSAAVVPGVALAGEPLVLGGPEKSCKTLASIELAAAITTGTPFLGRPVAEPGRVVAFTLETPVVRWLDFFRRAVRSRDCDPIAAEKLVLATDDLKPLRSRKCRDEFQSYILMAGVKLVSIDPLYLCIPDAQASDLAAQGKALRRLTRHITEAGATPAILAHFTKGTNYGVMPTLRDLSGSAVGPFARSWLLLNRESEYAGAVHELLALTGTSAGDCGQHRIRFDEEKWCIEVRPASAQAEQPTPRPKLLQSRTNRSSRSAMKR